MRNFLLGVISGVVVMALAGTALLFSVRGATSTPAPSATSPSASPGPTANRPSAVAAGETWLATVSFTSSDVLTDGGGFLDVKAEGEGVTLSGKGIRAQRLDLEATLPWVAAATQVGDGVTLYAAGNGRAGVSRTVTLLGQDVPVKATGTVRAEDGLLVIEPEEVDLQGPAWLDRAASALARTLITIRQPVQGVPAGMKLTKVSVIDSGFRAALQGTNITIGK